ncbi:MAG: PIG-L family deacetylase [bacterium]|nr:PIG-L family deacetylase [bacterium]
MKTYYVSPHYDDAIGSCGGKIYFDFLSNISSTIITVFSEVEEPFSEYAKKLHDYWKIENPYLERKKENENACIIVKAHEINLPYKDAIYRSCNNKYLYPNDGDIFNPINSLDNDLCNQIIENIKSIIKKDDIVYFPLGVGNHVDHMIVHNVGVILKKEGYNIKFYRDFSYKCDLVLNNEYKKNIFKLSDELIEKKSIAMSKYVSQIEMLFENKEKIIDYYKIKLKGIEEYYE